MEPDDGKHLRRCGSLIIGGFEHLANVNECVFAAAIVKQGSASVFYLRHRGINSPSKGYRESFW